MKKILGVFAGVLCALTFGCASPQPSASPSVVHARTCSYAPAGEPAKAVDPPPSTDVPTQGDVAVTLNFEEGPVTITLDRAKTPCTTNSFVSLAKQGYYTNTKCHRLVEQGIFVLQCGDPTGTGAGGPGYTFNDELSGSETYPPGVVAMANAGPNTNGSQFFFVWADSPLPPKYTVFGTIDKASAAVIATIAGQGIDGTAPPAPISPARIQSVVMG